jgi:hypothetical protein
VFPKYWRFGCLLLPSSTCLISIFFLSVLDKNLEEVNRNKGKEDLRMDDRPLIELLATVLQVSTGSWILNNENEDDADEGGYTPVGSIVASMSRLTMRVNDRQWYGVAFQHV